MFSNKINIIESKSKTDFEIRWDYRHIVYLFLIMNRGLRFTVNIVRQVRRFSMHWESTRKDPGPEGFEPTIPSMDLAARLLLSLSGPLKNL